MNNKILLSFIDGSGNFDLNDRFFGVGMLTVENPGSLTDFLHSIFQKVMAVSQSHRDQIINSLVSLGRQDEVISMLKKSKKFELKYDRMSPVKFSHYKEMINLFLSRSQCRFSCMVIDRKSLKYNSNLFKNTWEAYTSYIASLIVPELTNLPDREMFLVLDEISKPRVAPMSLEETVLCKIRNKTSLDKYKNKKLGKVVGAIRIESHSNLIMQLTDVLLGCTMFDFKVRSGMLTDKFRLKKEDVVSFLRNGINRNTLAGTFTVHKPVYFHVWEVDFGKN